MKASTGRRSIQNFTSGISSGLSITWTISTSFTRCLLTTNHERYSSDLFVIALQVGPRGHVYGFEPLASHVEICQYNFSSAQNISIAPFGLADHTLYAPPVASATYSPGFRADWTTDPVPMTTLDEYVTSHKIERIDFFKLDIEGSELAALRGARGTLLRDRPKLALSVYHKPNDYFEIAKFVTELGCGYRLFLEHHTIYGEETVLYATA
jgi:FkbM family methyltransferase